MSVTARCAQGCRVGEVSLMRIVRGGIRTRVDGVTQGKDQNRGRDSRQLVRDGSSHKMLGVG